MNLNEFPKICKHCQRWIWTWNESKRHGVGQCVPNDTMTDDFKAKYFKGSSNVKTSDNTRERDA